MTAIFLSHSSADNDAAVKMKVWLKEQGHTSLFLDFDPEAGIRAGGDWEQTLYHKLRQCQAVIALLTPNWLTSKWCFAELVQAREKGKAIFPVKVQPCEVGGVFGGIQHIDLTEKTEEGYQRLALGLKERGLDPRDVYDWDPERPPYPGLRAFQEDDAAIFFGRGEEILKGLETLDALHRRGRDAPRLALFLGASGSGKSSLVRAGVIPRLKKTPSEWLPVTPFRPQDDPLVEVALALAHEFKALGQLRDWKQISKTLQSAAEQEPADGRALLMLACELCEAAEQREATVVLTIDQAEELFGYSTPEAATRFLRLLRATLEVSDRQLMAMATMRSDFLGEFQTHRVLHDPAYDHEFAYQAVPVDPMPERNFAEIIRGPAALAGLRIEEGLVEAMVHDTGTRDALPLLAFTLRRLYERYAQDGQLDIREYNELGRLEGAIRFEAEQVLADTAPTTADLDALRAAFVPTMVRINAEGGYARRRAYADEMPPRAKTLLKRFVDARLLVSDLDKDGRETLEVSHEALLRTWPQLTGWLADDQDKLRLLESLHRAAADWGNGGQLDDLLVHRDGRLKDVETLMTNRRFAVAEGSLEKLYLDACVEAQRAREAAEREEQERRFHDAERIAVGQRKLAQRTFVGLLAALVLAIGAGFAGWMAWNKADEAQIQRIDAEQARLRSEEARVLAEKQAQVALARQLALQAQAVIDWYPQRALLLAVESVRRPLELFGAQLPGPETAFRDLLSKVGGTPVIGPFDKDHFGDFKSDEGHSPNLLLDPEGRWVAVHAKDRKSYNVFSLTDTTVPPLHISVPSNIKLYPVFDPQGRWLAINGADGVVQLWGLLGVKHDNPGAFVELKGNEAGISDLAFDREGHYLAAATYDGYVLVWDTTDLEKDPQKLKAWEQNVTRLAFDSQGRWLAAISKGKVGVWNLTDLAQAPTVLPGRLRGPYQQALAIGPNGRWIAAGDTDRGAYLWDLTEPTAEPITAKLDVGQYVRHVAFDPMGRWMAMDTGYVVRLVNLADPTAPLVIPKVAEGRSYQSKVPEFFEALVVYNADPTAPQTAERSYQSKMLAFDPKGRWLAISDKNSPADKGRAEGHIRLLDLTNPTLPQRVLRGHEQRVMAAVFSDDGRWLTAVGADRVVRRWDVTQTGAAPFVLYGHEGLILSIAVDPTGRWLASANGQGEVQLSDLTKPANAPRRWDRLGSRINAGVSFDPSGRWLIFTYGHTDKIGKDVQVRLWDFRDPEALKIPMITLSGKDQEAVNISRYRLDPLGRWLVAGIEKSNSVLLWNLKNPESSPLTFQGHEARVTAIEFDPAGKWLATGDDDGNTCLWDLQNPSAAPRVLPGPGAGVHHTTTLLPGSVRRIKIDSAGRWIRVIYASGAKKILEWELTDPVAPPRTPKPYQQLAQTEDIIAVDSLWRWIVTRDTKREYRLRETAHLDGPAQLLSGPGRFRTFRFDAQGRWLATGGIDGTVRLWPLTDSRSGQVVLRGHDGAVKTLDFDTTERRLATGGTDGTVRLWDLRIENMLDLACQIAGRNLSEVEWNQYMSGIEYRATCPSTSFPAKAESHQERADNSN